MAKSKEETSVKAPPPPGGAVGLPNYGEEHVGGGYEGTGRGDFLVPFLLVLQSNSPQVDGSSPAKKIKGAEAGMFHVSTNPRLFEGEKRGVVIVPCVTEHIFTEWLPRKEGGGFRGQHKPDSPVVAKARAAAGGTLKFKTEGGNDLTETYNVYAILLDPDDEKTPLGSVLLSITGTKIKHYRGIMTRLKGASNGGKIPLYANKVRVLSWQDKNTQGNFKNVKFEAANGDDIVASLLQPDDPLLAVAKKLKDEVLKGTARVDYAAHGQDPAAEAKDGVF